MRIQAGIREERVSGKVLKVQIFVGVIEGILEGAIGTFIGIDFAGIADSLEGMF